MSSVTARRRKRLRKTKAQLIDELEQAEERLAGNGAAALENINAAGEMKDARIGRAIENLAEGLAFYDTDDRLIFCNEEYRRLHPVIRDLLKPGVRFEDLVQAHTEREAIPEAKGRKKTYIRERMKQHRHPKGPIIRELVDDIWFIINEGRTPDGGTYAIITGITQLKKIETDLRRSQEQFAGAVAALQEGFALYDSDDRLVVCNDEYRRLHPKVNDILKPGMLFEDLVRASIDRGVNADAIGHEEKHIRERIKRHRNPKGPILRTLTDGSSFIINESLTPDGGVVVTETDITERSHAEQALLSSDERLRGAIESLQEGFALFDAEDRLVALNDKYRDVNPAAQEIMERGGTFEDVIRANIKRGALIEAIGREEAFIKDRLRKHRNPKGPIIRRISDGSWYMIQEVKTPEGGTALSFINITDLKKTEEALIKSEERLRGAIESLQEGFALFDAEDRLVMINDVYRKINPAAQKYLKRQLRYEDLMRTNVESGRIVEAIGHEKEFLRERMKLHRNPKGPIIRQYSDGSCYILKETRTPEGGIALTFTEITELKRAESALRESEERFRDVAESAGDWIWEMGPDLRFTFLSPRFYDLFPVEPEKIIGKTRDEFAGAAPDDERWRRHLNAIANHKPFRDFEYVVTLPTGHTRYIRISGKPVIDGNGTFQGYRGTGTDVTVAVEAEAAAAKAHANMIDAIESIAAGFALFDSDDRLVLCNTRYQNLHPAMAGLAVPGILFQELMEGTGKADIYHQSMGPLDAFLEKRMALHRNTPSSHEQQYADGRWLEINEHSTQEGGTVLIWTDITERKKAEQALSDSEDLLNSIIENVPVGLLIKDTAHIVERANKTYLNWYGFDGLTITGRRSDEIEDFQSDQEAAFMNTQEREVLTTGLTQARQVDRLFTDGKIHTIEITKFPVYDQQETITKVGSVSVDLTEQVQARKALAHSEMRFRGFAESSSDWLWEMDEHLRFTYFSERNREITGFDPTIYLGKTRSEITPEDKNDEKWRQHYSDLENHRPFRDFRYNLIRADGSRLAISINGNPVFEEDGNFCGYRGTGTDITERKMMERQLAGSQRMEALGKLTGGVAHDFNNLLTVILGNLQLLERRLPDQLQLKRYVELASGAAQRGAEVTTRLLTFARRQRLDLTVFDTNDLVTGMDTLLLGTLGETIRLEKHLADELWPVKADPTQLENALLNLVINAKDAMPEGGRLTIETENVTVDNTVAARNPDAVAGDYVMIAVGDTGCGMPSDVADHALEPFFTTKEIGKGTGLGLSLAYGFVKQSGGYAKIYSEENRGTVVKLYLPRFQTDEALLADEEALQEEPVGGKEIILVVEDDPDVRQTTIELLEELGYQVIEAEDGPSALRVLDKNSEIDLLFTDVVMPGGMKGPELAFEVRNRRPGMKVLYMSGYTGYGPFQDDRNEVEGMLLSKPFDKGELAEKLRLTLDS